MPENVEVLLDVRISISIIFPDIVSRELGLRRLVQTSCQTIRASFPDGCEATPASGVHPLLAIACSIDVNGDENYLTSPKSLAELIDATTALLQGNVFSFGYEEPAVQPQLLEPFADTKGEVSVVGVLAEMSVRAAFAGRVKAVAIVEKYDHNCRLGFDDKLERICGNNYFREIPLPLH